MVFCNKCKHRVLRPAMFEAVSFSCGYDYFKERDTVTGKVEIITRENAQCYIKNKEGDCAEFEPITKIWDKILRKVFEY